MVIEDILSRFFRKRRDYSITEIERRAREYKPKTIKPPEKKGFLKWFEKGCKFSGKILQIKPTKTTEQSLREAILTTDMDVTPTQIFSFTILLVVSLFLLILPIMFTPLSIKVILPLFPFIIGYLVFTYPTYLAAVTKIRAADETIKAILYMVIYLRFNPHIEGAMNFAAIHCPGPIGNDFRDIIWGLEGGKYLTVKEAVGAKMEKWMVWDKEYVESINLLESLTRMGSSERRKETLDKSLTYILESTYEKMKDYSRDLKTPMSLIHTMGITFPLMGLVMFPMISIFLHDTVNTSWLASGYIVILPLILFWYLKRTISKRPGAFAYPDISNHPDLPPQGKYVINLGEKKLMIPVLPVALMIGLLISIPGLVHFAYLYGKYHEMSQNEIMFEQEWKMFLKTQYEPKNLFVLSLYGLTVVWGIGFGLVIYFLGTSYQRLKIRNEIKMIEDEFQVALFKLSDILSSGIPIETALEEVTQKYKQSKMESSPMYSFFLVLIRNMRRLGMTLEAAIFDKKYGGILKYPSELVRDIMRIIVSSAQKSSLILSMASKTISSFLQKTKHVEALLKELLDDISSAIKLQASFIAPFICAIVATMATFIIQLLEQIAEFLAQVEQTFNLGGTFVHGSTLKFGEMMGLVRIEDIMPPTVFQLIVGIYMIEIVMILAFFLNGIRNGFDITSRNVLIGKTLIGAIIFYSILLILSLFITRSFMPLLQATPI